MLSDRDLSVEDLYLFGKGEHECAWQFLGAHPVAKGTRFSVWAPAASFVSVVGDFNNWDENSHSLLPNGESGIWSVVVPGAAAGMHYKYFLRDAQGQAQPLKADPYARESQLRPETASMIPAAVQHEWQDEEWLAARQKRAHHQAPLSIYEVHAGSWRRGPDNRFLNYRELADLLLPYVKSLGFTHVQLMPISEFPFDGSWGYQPTGMFSPTRRFGSPDDLRYFIDSAHQQGIGVLLDWVPGHFPADDHGLARFDGSHLYEHADPRQGWHPDWDTLIYNYSRAEVISFLLSSAVYWLEEFHFDGLRVDAVASMLYLNYSRKDGEWLPNRYGGAENLEAVEMLRHINERVYRRIPGVMMIAEESTAWPGVTQMTSQGGLGFGFKWNMGWMNDTLRYMKRDPVHRSYHHQDICFGLMYAFSEQFILPLSHDEVVHGKRSLIEKMPGDLWQKFANLRAYFALMWAHPGKKLLFMGGEFGQWREWNHDQSLDWHLLEESSDRNYHLGLTRLVTDMNRCLNTHSALYLNDSSCDGFAWLDADASASSVFAFRRMAGTSEVVIVVNLTPTIQENWRVGVPSQGNYVELLNTDSQYYGGSGVGNLGMVVSQPVGSHGQAHSLELTLPPLGALWLCKKP